MTPPKKSGFITVNGKRFTTKYWDSLSPSIQQSLTGTSSTTSTGTQLLLPNAHILQNDLEKQGMKPAQAAALAKKYGLQPLKLPTTGVGGATISVTSGLKEAVLALPPALQTVAETRLGFNDARLGHTLDERIAAMLPVLQNAQGHIGNVNLNEAFLNNQNVALKRQLGTYQGNPSLGTQPALINATPNEQYSATAGAQNDLSNWNMDTPDMENLVHHLVASGVTNLGQIMQNVRATPTYQKLFPGLVAYNAKPGQIRMTEPEYRTYSQAIQNAAQQYGQVRLNQGQVGALLNGNVSPAEFQQRVQDIGVAVQNADQGTKAILKQQYGIDPQHLFAYYANPKEALPDMQRAVASGEIQDYANRVGLGGLTPTQGNQLGDMAKLSATQGNNPLGYGVSNIEGSLLTASRDSALLHAAPGANVPTIDTNQLIGTQLAGFGGTTQAGAQLAVGRAEQARTAPFERGGGYDQSTAGVTGAGSAKT